MNTHLSKARAAQESGLVSLDTLAPTLSACWTIGAFGRQRLYILSGKFGPEQRFCSRYVVYPESGPELPQACTGSRTTPKAASTFCRTASPSCPIRQD